MVQNKFITIYEEEDEICFTRILCGWVITRCTCGRSRPSCLRSASLLHIKLPILFCLEILSCTTPWKWPLSKSFTSSCPTKGSSQPNNAGFYRQYWEKAWGYLSCCMSMICVPTSRSTKRAISKISCLSLPKFTIRSTSETFRAEHGWVFQELDQLC